MTNAPQSQVKRKPTTDLEREFRELANQWKREVGHLSVSSQIAAHPAYQSIIEMGEQALPLILKDLEAEPDHWLEALVAISDETPHIPEHHKGNLIAISKAWVEWGKMNAQVL